MVLTFFLVPTFVCLPKIRGVQIQLVARALQRQLAGAKCNGRHRDPGRRPGYPADPARRQRLQEHTARGAVQLFLEQEEQTRCRA